jgi:hypothetical protein
VSPGVHQWFGLEWRWWAVVVVTAGTVSPVGAASPDFNRDVRPILSQFCFKCHGPDDMKREAGLRLDEFAAATTQTESGVRAIVPRHPEASELITRVMSTDADVVMPPPATHQKLTPAQKQILRDWIASGAEYQPHWAYVPPQWTPLPKVQQTAWPRNDIDYDILAELEQRDLAPSPEAERATLIRRVSLDLVGLPPTVEEVDAFVTDGSPDAYERLVDRLLASPRYGERWARRWLDLARYADTNGYEKDRVRTMWPYRDWVINALNADLPFDQFTIEQLAGDLLPNATLEQRIATGFHRNTMINEEGGIDPLEFRFHAMTDRVGTTSTVWLGLTLACAQCHTHKYDPIDHKDYYRFMAFLNNADEPEWEVPSPAVLEQRAQVAARVSKAIDELPLQFPPTDAWQWTVPSIAAASSEHRAELKIQDDRSILVAGNRPEVDTYTVELEWPADASSPSRVQIEGLKLEALTDASLGQQGPGRSEHGNFVLNDLRLERISTDGTRSPLVLKDATTDFAQEHYPASAAIDDQPGTGWAIYGPGKFNVPRTLTVSLSEPVDIVAGDRWVVTLSQQFGTHHTLGKFRLSLGRVVDPRPVAERAADHYRQKLAAWVNVEQSKAVTWTVVQPRAWTTTLPKLEQLADGSLLASGDQAKRDLYRFVFGAELTGATGLRIEAIADERLPKRGPGRVYYEGPFGDFFLSEVRWQAGSTDAPWLGWKAAQHSFAAGNSTAAAAIDGDPLSGWSVNGGQGRSHVAVFALNGPAPKATEHHLELLFERYYACGLGRFRFSITTDPLVESSSALPPLVEAALLTPTGQRTSTEQDLIVREFCQRSPDLATARAAVNSIENSQPTIPTSLVFVERPADNPRPTRVYRRGEFLQPLDEVFPAVPGFLHELPANEPVNRLTLARWLVAPENPLAARVTVNRHWQAFFGRGLVRTLEDFGYQGELPSHPALLDRLALELVRQNWSIKALHRLFVTSATYRQSSRVTPELLAQDPQNLWLSRAPRLRLEAELVRDTLLALSGSLSDKMLGPSVFPPQPPNVTTEGAYGQLSWTVSPGEDRHRRGLYTFAKRTAPFAMFTTFDAPSGEACVPRRDVSNTPLQALTLLNDSVFLETAQRLGERWAGIEGEIETKSHELFRHLLARSPTPAELEAIVRFHRSQLERVQSQDLPAAPLAGLDEKQATQLTPTQLAERAAWTATARALLNLDETIIKE